MELVRGIVDRFNHCSETILHSFGRRQHFPFFGPRPDSRVILGDIRGEGGICLFALGKMQVHEARRSSNLDQTEHHSVAFLDTV